LPIGFVETPSGVTTGGVYIGILAKEIYFSSKLFEFL
jgi:glutamine amidotransferase-like uncharacterized protein